MCLKTSMLNTIATRLFFFGLICFAPLGITSALAGYEHEYIIGGAPVTESDPVASSTVLVTDGNYICTGSIIDRDIVVTAAHCVAAPADHLKIVFALSLSSLDSPAQSLQVSGYVANPGWRGSDSSGNDQHDIAVIRFSGTLPAGYAPANLLSESESNAIQKGDMALLAGYGITNAQTQDGAGTLREVEVKVKGQLGSTEVVLDQRQGKGACHGDSGGPAFAHVNGQLLLWGVTNRGYPDTAPDDCRHYAVYTRIQAYADWISASESELRSQKN